MSYVIQRNKAIEMINNTIALQDNELLQRLYCDKYLASIVDQSTLFKLWHGFVSADELSDNQLSSFLQICGYDVTEYSEYRDDSECVTEYLSTIANPSTQYQVKTRLQKVVQVADAMFVNALPLLSPDEAAAVVDVLLNNYGTATVQRMVYTAISFCDWCIKEHKIPNAQNNFKALSKISYDSWVKRCLVKDENALDNKMRSAGLSYTEGDSVPVLLVLAWMGYSGEKAIDLKNEDIDLFTMTVQDQPIPPIFHEIFRHYISDEYRGVLGENEYCLLKEDLGYFIKRRVREPNGRRFDKAALNAVMQRSPCTCENVVLSGHLYRLYLMSGQTQQDPSDEILRDLFQVKSVKSLQHYRKMYDTYKKVFWEKPGE